MWGPAYLCFSRNNIEDAVKIDIPRRDFYVNVLQY